MMLAWPGSEREALDDFIFFYVLTMRLINMMLAWPGSEREASDDFIFVVTIRLIAYNYYDFNPSQNHHFVIDSRKQLKATKTNCEILKFETWQVIYICRKH